jgi:hypothetical protein
VREFQRVPSDLFLGSVWRVVCADNPDQIALLLRITPQSEGPFICSGLFELIQGGQQITAAIRQTPESTSFCGDLFVATTFALERESGPAFDPKGAFTLVHIEPVDDRTSGRQAVDSPSSPSPSSPPAVPPAGPAITSPLRPA